MTAQKSFCNWEQVHAALDAAAPLRAAGLSPVDVLVLVVIARHTDPQGQCWLSYRTIAEEAICSRRTALRCVESLTAAGVLAIDGSHRSGANAYRIQLDQCHPVTSANVIPEECHPVTSANVTLVPTSHPLVPT